MSNLESRVFNISGQRSSLLTFFNIRNQELTIANLHLLWLARHSKRHEQLDVIVNLLTGQGGSAIIVGDFNYSNLVFGSGLIKYMKSKGFSSAGRLITHKLFGIKHQLDYAFLKGCTSIDIKTTDVNFSDHLPLLLLFEVSA